jgi:hypothetical protein
MEPITCRNAISDVKVDAEGALTEVQIVLGWSLNTCPLLITLPLNKFDTVKTIFGDLDTIVGRLNYASHVILLA